MTVALPATLERGRDLVEPHLRAAIDRLDPRSRQVASYHQGWIEADGRPADGGGKAVRPALALLSATAVGAPAETGIPGAVAVELVHNFSLLHDDLMDGDVQRRHRATVWAVWGPSTAILVGDAMLALAQQVLADVGGDPAVAAIALLGSTTQELIRGQIEDLAFEERSTVGVEECLSMAAGKTGALLGCSSAIGAVLAGADAATVAGLRAYGDELGLAFQLIDDLLGIWGDGAVTGKPVGGDLRARKKSLPVASALSSGTAAAAELEAWLATEPGEGDDADSDQEIAHASELVEAAGGREWAQAEAERRLASAEQALDDTAIDTSVRAELIALGRFIVARDS
jgi:geranylgeranyl diphosphate synthase, type I